MHISSRQFTWSHCRDNRISVARLDRFHCFKQHFNVVKTCRILPVCFTDHSMVLCCVFIRDISHRSAYWHFNSLLTADVHFKDTLSYFWSGFRDSASEFSCLSQWWDCWKAHRRHQIYQRPGDWCGGSATVEWVHRKWRCVLHFLEILKTKKMALANLLDKKVHGALVRSRIQNVSEMDAPSGFFSFLGHYCWWPATDFRQKPGPRFPPSLRQKSHPDQTYYVPGRSMVDNVYLIQDLLEVSSSSGVSTGLVRLDQENAFDRVERSFLCTASTVLYSDIESVLKTNGS